MAPGKRLKIMVHEWVTGGGMAGEPLPASWAAEGGAMRRAIAADFASMADDRVQVVMTLDERLDDDWHCGNITVAPITPEGNLDQIVKLARAADFTVLVAPETGGVLAMLTRRVEEAGGRTLGTSGEAVELAASKLKCAARLNGVGVPTPEVRVLEPGALPSSDFAYPVVVKPDDGAGCLDTFLMEGEEDWRERASFSRRAIVQPYIPGVPMSASFLADGRGRSWLLGVGVQDISVDGGRFVYHGGRLPVGEPAVDPSIRRAVETGTGLRGFVGVDFIKNVYDGSVTILEINPRPTTSYVALCRQLPPGQLAAAWLSVCAGLDHAEETCLGALASRVHAAEPLCFSAMGELSAIHLGGVAR